MENAGIFVYILRPFGIIYDHFELYMTVWNSLWVIRYTFPVLACLDQEKSGNPEVDSFVSEKGLENLERKNRQPWSPFAAWGQSNDLEVALFVAGKVINNSHVITVSVRVARFSLTQYTKTGENIPNHH
jgi:hypothetical protein